VRILGLDHLSVTTADIERSLGFYRDVLGLVVRSVGEVSGDAVERITGVAGARLLGASLDLGGGQSLELIEYARPGEQHGWSSTAPGSGQIGLAVDDLDGARRRLADAGITIRSEPTEVTEGGSTGRRMTVIDPDGMPVELVERSREPATARSRPPQTPRAEPPPAA
jgi:catechol 2,3-dioxygenase-like lactoylglutathione lyase family enzyme